jgi:hypothetical protein
MGNLSDFFSAGSESILVQAKRSELLSRVTISGSTPVEILTCSITPQFSDSILEISGVLSHTNTYVMSWGIYKDSSPLYSISPNSNDGGLQHTAYEGVASNQTGYLITAPFAAYVTAGSTSQQTFALRATCSWSTGAYTAYVGDRDSNDMRSKTFLFIKEIRP